jgi:hypothetical protein
MTVRTDATGLHAEDCECPTCETGYRPTELERAVARRSLEARAWVLARPVPRTKAEAAKLSIEERHRQEVAATDAAIEKLRKVPAPMTEAERAEVRAMIRAVRG